MAEKRGNMRGGFVLILSDYSFIPHCLRDFACASLHSPQVTLWVTLVTSPAARLFSHAYSLCSSMSQLRYQRQ